MHTIIGMVAQETQKASLIILDDSGIQTFLLDEDSQYVLGRKTPYNLPDIVVDSRIVGRQHGEFLHVGRTWFYADSGSINGTFYNGKKIKRGINNRKSPIGLSNGDILCVDSYDLSSNEGAWILFTTDKVIGTWKAFFLNDKSIVTIGSDKETCQIVINEENIAPIHAKISRINGKYYIEDCHSRMGTRVNNQLLKMPSLLLDKSDISICGYHIIFSADYAIYYIDNDVGI